MKKISARALFGFLVLMMLSGSTAFANHGGCGKSCSLSHSSQCESCCGRSSHGGGKYGQKSHCPVTNKFFEKAHKILEHKDEIGLTDEQEKAIKALKVDVKKREIRAMADMQIFNLDVMSKMKETAVDVEGIDVLIDDATAKMSQNVKATIQDYAKLKAIITPEQLETLKASKKN